MQDKVNGHKNTVLIHTKTKCGCKDTSLSNRSFRISIEKQAITYEIGIFDPVKRDFRLIQYINAKSEFWLHVLEILLQNKNI
jgi:hypothetical protein